MSNIDINIRLTETEMKILLSARKIVNNIAKELWEKDIDGMEFSDGIQYICEGFEMLDNYLE